MGKKFWNQIDDYTWQYIEVPELELKIIHGGGPYPWKIRCPTGKKNGTHSYDIAKKWALKWMKENTRLNAPALLKKAKKMKKKAVRVSTVSGTDDTIYKLKIIEKSKKDAKKIKIGISRLSIGAEFGGQEQKSLELQCGNCKKSDKFSIEDPEKNLFRCVRCGMINQPFGKDLKYFK